MSDTKNPGEKTLHVSPKTLSLKRSVEQNTVRQSFSHGRSKAVVVETVKRRAPGTGPKEASAAPAKVAAPAPAAAPTSRAAQPAARPAAAAPAPAPAAQQRGSGVVLRTLSEQERDARLSALTDAKRREEEDRHRQGEEAKRRAEREARDAREREAAEARKHDEEERRRREDERKRRAEDEARRRLGEEAVPQRTATSLRMGNPGDARRPMSLDHMARPAPAPAPSPT